MDDPMFRIGANGVDAAGIVADIRETVAEKTRKGVYSDPRVAKAERSNVANLTSDDDFAEFYLDCLREAVSVDIADFEIVERRTRFSGVLVGLKRLIWAMLRFYTYRLWSQQNQVNGLLLSAVEGIEARYKDKLHRLEERLDQLERQPPTD